MEADAPSQRWASAIVWQALGGHALNTAEPEPQAIVGPLRLAIGFAQGIAAWLLLELVGSTSVLLADGSYGVKPDLFWSARHPTAFAAVALITAFVPVVALAELGRMRARRLAIYLAAITAALILLTFYDILRDPFESGVEPRIWPSGGLILCAGIALFIVNQLLEFRETGQRFFTHYALHFEESWMRGFQFVLSLGFTLLVWGVLLLGAALFDLIHVTWFGEMLEHNWFRCPVLGLAFAASVHITDVRPALLRGMRNLGLTLLAWLLPLITALGAAFLAAILINGVGPLWETRRAAAILLTAVSVTLVLLNAAYKDGDPAHAPAAFVRWAGRIAGPVMLVLALLAIWAIALRVGQYGWTPQRVRSAATAAMGLYYSAGYTWAALDRATWLKRLERVNVTASFAVLAILIGMLTPLADPARIAVSSQVARLHSGKVSPDKFDYGLLRFDTGRAGTEALAALTNDPNPDIAARAKRARDSDLRSYGTEETPDAAVTEAPFAHAKVYPAGAVLPPDFRNTDWKKKDTYGAQCLRNGKPCDIIILQGGGTNAQTILVLDTDQDLQLQSNAPAFERAQPGDWIRMGTFRNLDCAPVIAALRAGKVARVRPQFDDFEAGGIRLEVERLNSFVPCPAPPPKAAPTSTTPGKPADARAPAGLGPAFGNPGPN